MGDPIGTKRVVPTYYKMNERFDQVWASASSTFRINRRINIIVVSIGISLIAYGLIFQWYDTFVYKPSTASPTNTSHIKANETSNNTNSGNQQEIPNLTGLISSATGLATIVGLFFFKSQAHIQRAFTNLALTNMISTACNYSFQRLDWYLWCKYIYPTEDKTVPDFPKGDFTSLENIKVSEFTDILNPMLDLTKDYCVGLYNLTRLMDDPEFQPEGKGEDDKVSNGQDGNKTDTTSSQQEQKP